MTSNGPTPREWGTLTAKCDHQAHQLRNTRMIVDALAEDTQDLSKELVKLEQRLATARTQSKTALTVLVAVVGALVWIVELLMRLQ